MDQVERIVEAVRGARADGRRLQVGGQGSKRGWLPDPGGALLEVPELSGIVNYDPAELVITAWAGTPLRELQAVLAREGQVLAFDPPQFYGSGTVGGAVSCGLSGPSRPWHGATRDAVLGVEMINGRSERLNFGGQVMKNVAGYDVSRLLAGAWGALGVILKVSLRVQPMREHVVTVRFEEDAAAALARCRTQARSYLPVSATCWMNGRLCVRLDGSEAGVTRARRNIGGDVVDVGRLWTDVRDHGLNFFKADSAEYGSRGEQALWRVVVPPAAPLPEVPVSDLALEWGGGLRWLWHQDADWVQAYAAQHKGWAWAQGSQQPVPPVQQKVMQAVRQAFDPDGVFASPLMIEAAETADAH